VKVCVAGANSFEERLRGAPCVVGRGSCVACFGCSHRDDCCTMRMGKGVDMRARRYLDSVQRDPARLLHRWHYAFAPT
jgi:hypothetical protein